LSPYSKNGRNLGGEEEALPVVCKPLIIWVGEVETFPTSSSNLRNQTASSAANAKAINSHS
jgi:hypothetical protein